ncbi:MAG: hypothetical protein JXQ99_01710 [Hyphomicrobiaceae bacterium]
MSLRQTTMSALAIIAVTASVARAEVCTRLPLSDVAFGKPAATDAAREKLREYAGETLKKRGWSGAGNLKVSNETVSCKLYLDLGPLGTEYRCLVTATFCGS